MSNQYHRKMKNRCLYCYQSIEAGRDFHKECTMEFFGSPEPPKIDYTLDQMDKLAKDVIERSVTIPGVQAKLSMSLIQEAKEKSDMR